ncbi:hypothetical protein PV04_03290 [Phialophora macrospora]|uniref:Uncharacterized protein n=1 Tax=Phialophora macrospora TaxID=1851006 RepID=A0A0D2E9W3_9EURO|nr:hypothetical protein PV04_03290 [Phialophora macrospora]
MSRSYLSPTNPTCPPLQNQYPSFVSRIEEANGEDVFGNEMYFTAKEGPRKKTEIDTVFQITGVPVCSSICQLELFFRAGDFVGSDCSVVNVDTTDREAIEPVGSTPEARWLFASFEWATGEQTEKDGVIVVGALACKSTLPFRASWAGRVGFEQANPRPGGPRAHGFRIRYGVEVEDSQHVDACGAMRYSGTGSCAIALHGVFDPPPCIQHAGPPRTRSSMQCSFRVGAEYF